MFRAVRYLLLQYSYVIDYYPVRSLKNLDFWPKSIVLA